MINVLLFIAIILTILSTLYPVHTIAQDSDFDISSVPAQIKFIRAYGEDNERYPPIVLIGSEIDFYNPVVGYPFITIEFDVAAEVPPALYAKFIHCNHKWEETENIFLSDIIGTRTTLFEWDAAPIGQNYYGYKGKLQVPNGQIKFKFSGNWKAKIYDMDRDGELLAETRFFVVEPKSRVEVGMFPEFYSPEFSVSSTGLVVEGIAISNQTLIDGNASTSVLYKNNRWFEPYVISSKFGTGDDNQYRYKFKTMVSGFLSAGKRYRIEGLPSENSYRILNLADLSYYPSSTQPLTPPFSDLRRNGTFYDYDDDGAMITDYVPYGYEEYLPIEFRLDPEGRISREDVFVVGSFNNWVPDAKWQMFWDEEDRFYKLRQWIPRARHNYLYATGKLNIDNFKVERYSYDEYEGNTTGGNQTYIMLIYYREFDYGGYDSIIGVGASNISGQFYR